MEINNINSTWSVNFDCDLLLIHVSVLYNADGHFTLIIIAKFRYIALPFRNDFLSLT